MAIQKIEDYPKLLALISDTYLSGQAKAIKAVNSNLIQTYWELGQLIILEEQQGKARAD